MARARLLSFGIGISAPLGSTGHIAIVGAGVFGAWTAHHMLRGGHRVTLIDCYGPANARASSGGETRMTRGAYGKDSLYARMALNSLPAWRDLSDTAGLPVFLPHGVLYFFRSEEPYFLDSLTAHSELGIPSEALTPREMQRRFPMIDFDGVEAGLFEPDFGSLLARRAVQTLVARFVQDGGTYLQAEAMPPSSGSGPLTDLTLSNGDTIAADRFIFAAGPWLPKLFPDLLGRRIIATRQEVFFFAAPPGDPRFLPGAMPGWADFNGGDMFYGFPDIESRGVKFAHDRHGPVVDPETQDRRPSERALAEVIAFRDCRFPLLKSAQLTESRVCQYENSSNGDFLIDFHPDFSNVLLVGGGSGHGFKHGPEVGRYAASLALDGPASEPRFSLATKAETHNREVH